MIQGLILVHFFSPGLDWGKNNVTLELIIVLPCILMITKKIILGESSTQVLYDTAITAEVKCFINFSRSQRKNVLGLHHKESNSFSFVYATKTISIVFTKYFRTLLS